MSSIEQSPSPAPGATPARRGVRLSVEEAWEVVERAHTGILGTLRRDGVPIMLPIWFVAVDRSIYIRTGDDSRKARRLRLDPRASFLVESGEHWAELRAVHFTGTTSALGGDDPLVADLEKAFEAKYSSFRTAPSKMGAATRAHYARPRVFFRFTPDEHILSWDNRHLRLR